jgi:hypothetical protein
VTFQFGYGRVAVAAAFYNTLRYHTHCATVMENKLYTYSDILWCEGHLNSHLSICK